MEYPKPVKRLPKSKTKIRQVSAKQQRHNIHRQKAYQEMESLPPICQGCGSPNFIAHSHRIGQAKKEHVGNVKNIDIFCSECHAYKWECGRVWLLDNGQEAMEWLKETDFDAYRRKRLQMLRRVEESGICIEDLPGWTQEILNEIQ